jgi:hypothetical protein
VSPRKRRLQPAPPDKKKAKLLEQRNFLAFFMAGEEDDPRNVNVYAIANSPLTPALSPQAGRGGVRRLRSCTGSIPHSL